MIKTIVFDLGGVYYHSGTMPALQKIYKLVEVPKEKVNEVFKGIPGKEGWLYFKGKLTKQEFWDAAIKKLNINEKTALKFQKMWHSGYKPIKGMKDIVLELRKNYRVIAFSANREEIFDYVNEKYKINEVFDDILLSYKAGFEKGEAELYKILLKWIKCKPEESVFIDNCQEWLNIAQKFGIETILFKNPKQLKSELRKFGVGI